MPPSTDAADGGDAKMCARFVGVRIKQEACFFFQESRAEYLVQPKKGRRGGQMGLDSCVTACQILVISLIKREVQSYTLASGTG